MYLGPGLGRRVNCWASVPIHESFSQTAFDFSVSQRSPSQLPMFLPPFLFFVFTLERCFLLSLPPPPFSQRHAGDGSSRKRSLLELLREGIKAEASAAIYNHHHQDHRTLVETAVGPTAGPGESGVQPLRPIVRTPLIFSDTAASAASGAVKRQCQPPNQQHHQQHQQHLLLANGHANGTLPVVHSWRALPGNTNRMEVSETPASSALGSRLQVVSCRL